MRKLALCTLIAICIAALYGCGSSGGDNGGGGTSTVQILDTRVTPNSLTVQQNSTIQFLNSSGLRQQVVSGTLLAQGNPLTVHLITITNTGFSPTNTVGNLGDTVRFSNASFNTFVLDITNNNGGPTSTITLPVGNQQDFDFSSAGLYTISNHANSQFKGTVLLYGRPNPNGLFQSAVLNNGDVYTRQFTQTGPFQYFIENQNNPNQSFMTGVVNVQ